MKRRKKIKRSRVQRRGMLFNSVQLAEERVRELKLYGRPAIRIGRRVYEVIGWN